MLGIRIFYTSCQLVTWDSEFASLVRDVNAWDSYVLHSMLTEGVRLLNFQV